MPSDVVEQWIEQDRRWVTENFAVVQSAFAGFMQNGEWPEVRALKRKYAQLGQARVDVQAVVESKPTPPGLARDVRFDTLRLGVRHLVGLKEAAQLINLLVVVTNRAAEIYRSSEDESAIDSEDPAIAAYVSVLSRGIPGAQGPQLLVQRLPRLLAGDYPSPIHGLSGVTDGPWRVPIDEDIVLDFEDLGSPADYVERQGVVLERRMQEAAKANSVLGPVLEEMGPPLGPSGFSIFGRRSVLDPSVAADHSSGTTSTEESIIAALEERVPSAARCYRQALKDLGDSERISYRGAANELRACVWDVLEQLAPDDEVTSAEGFALEAGQKSPTQKQKARFILRSRLGDTARQTPEASLGAIEEHVASLTRGLYSRSSTSTHIVAELGEVKQIKLYVDAFLAEVLAINS